MKQLLSVFIFLASYSSMAQVVHYNISPVIINGTSSSNNLDSVKLHPAHALGTIIGKDSALHIWHYDPKPPASNEVGVDCRGNNIEVLLSCKILVSDDVFILKNPILA